MVRSSAEVVGQSSEEVVVQPSEEEVVGQPSAEVVQGSALDGDGEMVPAHDIAEEHPREVQQAAEVGETTPQHFLDLEVQESLRRADPVSAAAEGTDQNEGPAAVALNEEMQDEEEKRLWI